MGFIEASGAAQHLRDARIAAIYEGTNGIQAIDLVTRKITLSDGQAINDLIRDLMDVIDALDESNRAGFGATSDHLSEALGAFERASLFMIDRAKSRPADALASATAYQTLFGITLGGIALVKAALADQGPTADKRIALAKFLLSKLRLNQEGLKKSLKMRHPHYRQSTPYSSPEIIRRCVDVLHSLSRLPKCRRFSAMKIYPIFRRASI